MLKILTILAFVCVALHLSGQSLLDTIIYQSATSDLILLRPHWTPEQPIDTFEVFENTFQIVEGTRVQIDSFYATFLFRTDSIQGSKWYYTQFISAPVYRRVVDIPQCTVTAPQTPFFPISRVRDWVSPVTYKIINCDSVRSFFNPLFIERFSCYYGKKGINVDSSLMEAFQKSLSNCDNSFHNHLDAPLARFLQFYGDRIPKEGLIGWEYKSKSPLLPEWYSLVKTQNLPGGHRIVTKIEQKSPAVFTDRMEVWINTRRQPNSTMDTFGIDEPDSIVLLEMDSNNSPLLYRNEKRIVSRQKGETSIKTTVTLIRRKAY